MVVFCLVGFVVVIVAVVVVVFASFKKTITEIEPRNLCQH